MHQPYNLASSNMVVGGEAAYNDNSVISNSVSGVTPAAHQQRKKVVPGLDLTSVIGGPS